jgi:hypothetical protein
MPWQAMFLWRKKGEYKLLEIETDQISSIGDILI